MAEQTHYDDQDWSIHSITDTAALILYRDETAYVLGATRDTFSVRALDGATVAEDASVCHVAAQRSLTTTVTAAGQTTRLNAVFEGRCVSLKYFRDNELLLDDDASILTGYSAPARAIATDRALAGTAPRLLRLTDKVRTDAFFREQVLNEINQFADPGGGFGPIDYCKWVCKQCWHGMYLPHSCLACIFCNGFQAVPPNGGID